MKAVKVILWIIVVLILAVIIASLVLPKDAHVERSVTIDKPAKMVFDQVNDFKLWTDWSPWQDDQMVNSYEGPEKGVGAINKWDHAEMGGGVQEIVESTPHSYIKTTLNFMEQGTAISEWKFDEMDESTVVTWTLDSKQDGFFGGLINALFMKPAVGKSYEKGLNALKQKVEAMEEVVEEEFVKKEGNWIEEVPARNVAQLSVEVMPVDIGAKMGELYGIIGQFMGANELNMTGMPYAAFPDWNPEGPTTMICGMPVDKIVENEGGPVENVELPATKAVTAIHYGSYDKTGMVYEALGEYLKENSLEVNGAPWEVYLNDPMEEKDTAKWMTQVYYPIK